MTATPTDPITPSAARVWRFEVAAKPGEADPIAERAVAEAKEKLPSAMLITSAKVFLIEAPLSDDQANAIASELLADPVIQTAALGTSGLADGARLVEVHYKPGVMDPVAESTRDAIGEMFPEIDPAQVYVATGERYDIVGESDDAKLTRFAETALGNPVIQDVFLSAHHPGAFPHGSAYDFKLSHTDIRELDDEQLMVLSREGHLFLSLEEMKCIQAYYQYAGREPTDVELETLAQTWSEHCVHKTLKATINYTPQAPPTQNAGGDTNPKTTPDPFFKGKPNHVTNDDGSVTIGNLLKSTVAAATFKLKEDPRIGEWLVSVFDDNAGIVKFDQTHGVAIKVETHNHPSAIEPYGGAATGIGGCIRDIMGTGLSAKPIANTDTFCVAPPDTSELPAGVLHPKRVLYRVVDGVRDYGNRMGIPTVDGAVYFHDDYLANPLVFAGCVGLIPLDKCFGEPQPGDRIIILGGATGRDGIHGATFSSDELTDTHADEFNHAVQIGNAITEKKTLDVILQARDYTDPETGETKCLFSAISDCGAGGFSSAVGEMGEKVGAYVTLETAPLKYRGLSYTEIWISEAQERMPLAVPPEHVKTLKRLAEAEDVPFCDLGHFGYEEEGTPTLKLTYHGQEVGKLAMPFMHDGIPMPTREATWSPTNPRYEVSKPEPKLATDAPLEDKLLALLAHPNIASKHWVVRQYDHEVQGSSVVKPFVGAELDGPSDAAVLRPKLDSNKAIALSNGLAPHISEKANHTGTATDGDSYQMVLHAIDEAVRNAVCVGADPDHIAILDNFCWAKCDDPWQLGTLVRAAEACYDGALAFQTPIVSGKDSLSNQFTAEDGGLITIPQTMLISALGIVNDATKARTMDAKAPGNALFIVGLTTPDMGGSHWAELVGLGSGAIPKVDLHAGPANAKAVAKLIDRRLVQSAHDCSDGGLLVAAAEMAFAGRVGLDIDLSGVPADAYNPDELCFAESPSRYLLEAHPDDSAQVIEYLMQAGVPFGQVGTFANHQQLRVRKPDEGELLDIDLDTLRQTWLRPLDW
ncbi:MAG: AIR synthase-related protein [Planctomycetota bacterium]